MTGLNCMMSFLILLTCGHYHREEDQLSIQRTGLVCISIELFYFVVSLLARTSVYKEHQMHTGVRKMLQKWNIIVRVVFSSLFVLAWIYNFFLYLDFSVVLLYLALRTMIIIKTIHLNWMIQMVSSLFLSDFCKIHHLLQSKWLRFTLNFQPCPSCCSQTWTHLTSLLALFVSLCSCNFVILPYFLLSSQLQPVTHFPSLPILSLFRSFLSSICRLAQRNSQINMAEAINVPAVAVYL